MSNKINDQKDLLRCAVVGVGHLGRFHAQKYKATPKARLVAICDANAERGAEVAKELDVELFADAKELIGKVDAVTIAASTPAHYELAKLFLTEGVHVNVEKPMTSTSEQGEELCRIAKEKNLKLQVGHVERFNPALQAAQEKLGKPLFIECHRLAPFKPRSVDVDVVLDLMIHDLDVILTLVNSPVERISAVGTPVLTKKSDIANVRIEFESGATANVTASRVSQNTQRKFRVFQNDQYLSIDFGTGEVNLLTKTGEWKDDEIPLEADAWSLDKGDALLTETEAFIDAIVNDTECVVSGEQGLTALRLAERIMDDIQERLTKYSHHRG